MKLDWLADALRDEGVDVIEYAGWATRSNKPFDQFNPVGLIDHHTAGSSVLYNYPEEPFYSNASLATKCNITIRPDGVAVVLNAGFAYDSGMGAPAVLAAVKADKPLPKLDGLKSTISGNPHFIDIEVQHLGNGDPIVAVQREALIRCNAAICRHMGWDPMTRVIGHREWAPDRKVDPRWDGFSNPMPAIRFDTAQQLKGEDDMTKEEMTAVLHEFFGDKVVQPLNGMTTGPQRISKLIQDSVSHQPIWIGQDKDGKNVYIHWALADGRTYRNVVNIFPLLNDEGGIDPANIPALAQAIANELGPDLGQQFVDALASELTN